MKRIATTRPGNDCFYGECRSPGCPGRLGMSGRGHGIRGQEWLYAVVADDGLTALQLMVSTDIYPPTVPLDHPARCGNRCSRCGHGGHDEGRCGDVNAGNEWGHCRCDCPAAPFSDRRRGADLTFHVGFPTEKEMMRWWPPATDKVDPCDLLSSGWCDTTDTTGLGALDFFRAHGDPAQPEQWESFWLALEALAAEKAQCAREMRVDELYQRCNHCDGVGVVAKD